MTDTRDVSGVWYGSFAGTFGVHPNRFIAHLEEVGGSISGTTSEPDDFGDAGVLNAYVSGTRAGGTVQFVKQYDGAAHCAYAVDYSGTIVDDGTEITGEWRFGRFSGQFIMARENFEQELLAEERGVALDADVEAR